MRASLFFLLVLAGCGSGEQSSQSADNHGYGFAYDSQGVTGLKLRYSSVPHDIAWEDTSHYETVFEQVKACTGLQAPPPFVILTKIGDLGPQIIGTYISDPSLILVQNDAPTVLRHEMIHYVLDKTSGNPDPDHSSVFFRSCT